MHGNHRLDFTKYCKNEKNNLLSPLEPTPVLIIVLFLITAPCSDVCEAAFLDCVAGQGALTGNFIKRKKS